MGRRPTPLLGRLLALVEPDTNGGCWLWAGSLNRNGYGMIWGRNGSRSSHRASWELHRGPIPQGVCVLHRCDVRACVNPDHLFLGSVADNSADMYAKGRGVNLKGSEHGRALVTEADIPVIRGMCAIGVRHRLIGELYGMERSTVARIAKRQTWRHVP